MSKFTEETVMDALATVMDPELHINIVDLGLIYNVDINAENKVHVLMTLTTPGCPMATSLAEGAEAAVMNVDGADDVLIEITFEPPWSVNMMSDFAREKLGIA